MLISIIHGLSVTLRVVKKNKRGVSRNKTWEFGVVDLPGYKWLEIVPGRRGGRPTVKDTRVTVDDILKMLSAGWKPEEVAEELEIPLEAVYEALKFASEALKRVVVIAETPS
jgi:Uncharacterized conserved protein